MALHDIYWGDVNTLYVTEFHSEHTEKILSWGLRKIWKIAHAETYADRYELLGPDVPAARFGFLHDAFVDHNPGLLGVDGAVGSDEAAKQDIVLYNDPDAGPEKVWTWSHKMEERFGVVKELEYKSMRDCGYIFWDEKRLDGTRLLDQDWLDIDYEAGLDDETELVAPSYEEEMQSWKDRSALYRRGIHGYWEKKKGA